MEMLLAQTADSVPADGGPIAALMAMAFGTFGMVLILGFYVVFGLAGMTIAKKTNTPNEWMAWVPIANIYLLTQCAGMEWWWTILCFVPCVGPFAAIYIWWKVAEARGKPGPVALAMLIPFIGFLVPLYIAFAD